MTVRLVRQDVWKIAALAGMPSSRINRGSHALNAVLIEICHPHWQSQYSQRIWGLAARAEAA